MGGRSRLPEQLQLRVNVLAIGMFLRMIVGPVRPRPRHPTTLLGQHHCIARPDAVACSARRRVSSSCELGCTSRRGCEHVWVCVVCVCVW